MDSLNASEMMAVGGQLTNDAGKYENKGDVEYQWAVKAYHHAETYSNLISSVDPKVLKLTRLDNEIYQHFRGEFPNLTIKELDVDLMKTPEQKEKWRKFCLVYDQQVEDFNMGTLIRISSREEFSEQNSTLVVRIQFLAIEIARNREGLNDNLRSKHVPS